LCKKNENALGHEYGFDDEIKKTVCIWCKQPYPNEVSPAMEKASGLEQPTRAKGSFMERLFGIQPGGGVLNVYHIESDAFGVIGNAAITEVLGTLKKSRRRSFNAAKDLLKAYKLIKSDERLLSVSIGCDSLGNDLLIIVTLMPGAENIPTKEE